MSRPVHEPSYWRERLEAALAKGKPRHHAIMVIGEDRWRRIEDKHREILKRHVLFADSVLDCGCGWGRLLELMPDLWEGDYLGIDICPDFLTLARAEHPGYEFRQLSMAEITDGRPLKLADNLKYDWAIMVSIRPMIRREMGQEAWDKMESEIRKVARQLLYLEYDEKDEGSVE